MPMDAIVIVVVVGVFAVYMFYLVGIYVKLENRRSRILGKFAEIDKQIDNKLDIINNVINLIEFEELKNVRSKLIDTVCVNEKIKYNKILDGLIDDLPKDNKKIKKYVKELNNIIDKIDYSKEFYNESIYEYNIILSKFSGRILKKICKYSEYNTF